MLNTNNVFRKVGRSIHFTTVHVTGWTEVRSEADMLANLKIQRVDVVLYPRDFIGPLPAPSK